MNIYSLCPDDYSRYPVVEILSSLSCKFVIPVIDKIFSEFGVPRVFKTDNGSPFNSNEFKLFSSELGCHHRKITPYWPRANAEAERFMRTMKKINKNCGGGEQELETRTISVSEELSSNAPLYHWCRPGISPVLASNSNKTSTLSRIDKR